MFEKRHLIIKDRIDTEPLSTPAKKRIPGIL